MAEKCGSALNPEAGLTKVANNFGTGGTTGTYIKRDFCYQAISESCCFSTEAIFKALPQANHVKWALIVFVICKNFFVLT